jgi:hypothetical protein
LRFWITVSKNHAGAEKDGQDRAERRPAVDARVADDTEDADHADPAGEARAEHQHDRRLGAGQQVGQTDARQRGVRQRVAHQPLPPEHGEAAQDAADDAQDHAPQGDVAQRVVEQQVVHQAHHGQAFYRSRNAILPP